ncbi:hypothetical protein BG011_003715 [Mortierella polycephala]|uniref:Thioredoxin domain-containing protein n=1 Tax=Mortierella polycephala TaxID=41804 RepID=A0A9P6U3N4_9FUNG|nr:hypothetical protein BG011_003715 [Mortierella polycephala]
MKYTGSKSELDSQLAAAGSRLSFERIHTSTVFVEVEIDTVQDCAEEYRMITLPTILFLKNSFEVGRMVGANADEILLVIKKHEGGDVFPGTG